MARGSSIRVRREAAPPRSDLSIPRQELLWAANRDLCVAAKGQQIPVSRDDDRQPGLGLDDLGDLPELRVDLIGGGLGVAELRSGEDAMQLVEDGRGEDEAVRARQDSLEDVARRAPEDDGRAEATPPSFRPSRFARPRPHLKITFHRCLRAMYSPLPSG